MPSGQNFSLCVPFPCSALHAQASNRPCPPSVLCTVSSRAKLMLPSFLPSRQDRRGKISSVIAAPPLSSSRPDVTEQDGSWLRYVRPSVRSCVLPFRPLSLVISTTDRPTDVSVSHEVRQTDRQTERRGVCQEIFPPDRTLVKLVRAVRLTIGHESKVRSSCPRRFLRISSGWR